MKRLQVLLKEDTISLIEKEAKEKSISKSAIIRQKIEQVYKAIVSKKETNDTI
jgi:hypothetical protein